MKSYLVTGGAGFIGGALARALLSRGHRVVIIDNLSTGYRSNVPAEADFFEGDVQDASLYSKIPQIRYDAIYHIAGQSSGEISFDDPVYDLQTNTQSTLLLLKFAIKVGCSRLLYASTMAVYGTQPDAPVSEAAPCVPKSFYGVGKMASEHYLRIHENQGIRSTALRLFNVYGPGQNLENLRQGMVSIYLAQALRTGSVLVKGGTDRYRDFVYIDDVVDAFLACEESPGSFGQVLNVCTGRRTTVGEVLAIMKKRLRNGDRLEIRFEGATAGDLHGMYGSPLEIQKKTNWKPQVALEQGMDRMVDWAQEETS